MNSINLPDTPTRWQIKSFWLLGLSLVPLGSFIFAVAWGLSKHLRASDSFVHFKFRVSDYQSLNNYLTVIGIFNALVAFCVQELASRAATEVRTRALLSKKTSLAELLNTLPGSPDWKRYFTSKLAWKLLVVGPILSTAITVAGGILYKQGLVLSTLENSTPDEYPYTFISNCTYPISECVNNRYLQYGVAMSQARSGGEFSKGIETTENGLRVTFVAAPTVIALTSPNANITSIHAKSLAIVTDYRYLAANETLPIPRPNGTMSVGEASGVEPSLRFHGEPDIDWSVSVRHNTTPYQRVRGKALYCVVDCKWATLNGKLSLRNYTFSDSDCTQLDLGFWSNPTTSRAIVYGTEMTYALQSTIIMGENWNPNTSHYDVLPAAYVVPTMYAVIVLGYWGGYWTGLERDVTRQIMLSPTLKATSFSNVLAIETRTPFVIYLVVLLVIFIAHWIMGYFDRKAFVTEWAPLWFGLLSSSQQENIRTQIRNDNIFDSKGLEEINAEEALSLMMTSRETLTSSSTRHLLSDL